MSVGRGWPGSRYDKGRGSLFPRKSGETHLFWRIMASALVLGLLLCGVYAFGGPVRGSLETIFTAFAVIVVVVLALVCVIAGLYFLIYEGGLLVGFVCAQLCRIIWSFFVWVRTGVWRFRFEGYSWFRVRHG